MKKIVKLSLVFMLACIMMVGHVDAFSCNATIESTKTEFEKNEEFTLDFSISNIQSQRGVIALTSTLDYDKDSLTLVKMEGQNNWETPSDGASYNSGNGKIAITRNGLGKQNEVVFKMTFKVKPEAKKNLTISLKEVSIADGDETVKIDTVKKDITIKEANTNNPSNNNGQTTITPGTTTNNNGNNNTGSNNAGSSNKVANKTDTSRSKSKIPQTGTNDIVLISIGIVGAVAIVFCGTKMILIKNK